MKQGVGRKCILALALLLLVIPFCASIIITPTEVMLEDYSTQQETVITFYNDEAAPKKIEPIPDFHSTYLAPYTTIIPSSFILEPNAQQNVKIRTKFPSTLSPQIHSLIILPDAGVSKGVTLSFRPPGEQLPKLRLISVLAETDEHGETAIISITYKNSGNVYVMATPTVRISNDSGLQKQTTYPKPVMIHPDEEFSLDVLQDIQGMAAGDYEVEVETAYKVDSYAGSTTKERGMLYIEEQGKKGAAKKFTFSAELLYLSIGLLLIIGYIFIHMKHASGNKDLQLAQKEVEQMRKEVHTMADETRELIKDINNWFQQGVR